MFKKRMKILTLNYLPKKIKAFISKLNFALFLSGLTRRIQITDIRLFFKSSSHFFITESGHISLQVPNTKIALINI